MSDELDEILYHVYESGTQSIGKWVRSDHVGKPISPDEAKQAILKWHTTEVRRARMQLKLNVFAQFKDVMMKQELSARPPEGIRFRTPLEELTIILEREVPLSELKGDTDE